MINMHVIAHVMSRNDQYAHVQKIQQWSLCYLSTNLFYYIQFFITIIELISQNSYNLDIFRINDRIKYEKQKMKNKFDQKTQNECCWRNMITNRFDR